MLFRSWPKYGAQINDHWPMRHFPSALTTFLTIPCLSVDFLWDLPRFLITLSSVEIDSHSMYSIFQSGRHHGIWINDYNKLVNRKQANKQANKQNNTVFSYGVAANGFMISRVWSHQQYKERKEATSLKRKGQSWCNWWYVSGKTLVMNSVRMWEAWLGENVGKWRFL